MQSFILSEILATFKGDRAEIRIQNLTLFRYFHVLLLLFDWDQDDSLGDSYQMVWRHISKDWWPHKTITRWCNVAIFTGNILKVFFQSELTPPKKKNVIQRQKTIFQNCTCVCLHFGWMDSFHCLLFNVQWAMICRPDIRCFRYLAASPLMRSVVSGNVLLTNYHESIVFHCISLSRAVLNKDNFLT